MVFPDPLSSCRVCGGLGPAHAAAPHDYEAQAETKASIRPAEQERGKPVSLTTSFSVVHRGCPRKLREWQEEAERGRGGAKSQRK